MCGGRQHGPDHHPGPEPDHPDPGVREEQAEGAVRRAVPEARPHGGGEREHGAAQEARAQDQGAREQAGAGADHQDQDGHPDHEAEGAHREDEQGDGRPETERGNQSGGRQEGVQTAQVCRNNNCCVFNISIPSYPET